MTAPAADPALVIEHANRFEAIAADGFEGRPYQPDLDRLAERVRTHPVRDLAPKVAHALGIMIGFIEDGDPAGRFAPKVAILREAIGKLDRP
ncbi:hypothetical protein [Azospirillum rugosum]|uniref:Uncharacterized protein n=1 Tax=Azospirillum rugosum TaxID=416170 RepID=A0ABS4SN82_9PROT|nr:hypothetical protein [Azospirillum rugosum]MBP2294014.1 hypothetical protein [Azospirillum rugosum]MDQ0526799.1 hypothetical protein [Azospirillum rugosum]